MERDKQTTGFTFNRLRCECIGIRKYRGTPGRKGVVGAKRANDRRARPRDDGHARDVILTSVGRWRARHAPSATRAKSQTFPYFQLTGNRIYRETLCTVKNLGD